MRLRWKRQAPNACLFCGDAILRGLCVGRAARWSTRRNRMATIRHPKDFWSGLIFVAIGLFAIVYGSKYTLGAAARMGPGYFPRILGILLIVLGGILALRALRLDGPPLPRWKWRPTVVVLGSVVLFGAIVQPVGVALSTVILIVGASAASPEFRPREALIAGVLLAALAVGVFVIGLKLQLPIWPAFVS
ncbi:MAG: tripartite tricarboxylate transporter TctB family protein [Betaproteobacteria bacterium]|nr:MAG: tripartite tricarboxylate transporter TctB family protein [Betaproteobacteria bacterium]